MALRLFWYKKINLVLIIVFCLRNQVPLCDDVSALQSISQIIIFTWLEKLLHLLIYVWF